jgi:hypothetical protein
VLDAQPPANKAIIGTAIEASAGPSTRRVALIAWEGAPRGDKDTTKEFAELAERSGFTVLPISTLDPQPMVTEEGHGKRP